MSGAAVELRAVSVRFGALDALERVDLVIPAGAFVAIFGPNGGGKTTLLRVIAGLLKPTGGTALVLGESPEALPAARMGYVPQVKRLDPQVPAQALEVVATGVTARWPWRIGAAEAQARAAMKAAGAEHLAERRVGSLSGGELQRVYLARALARQPQLLLLDEPAAGIDVAGEAAMYHALLDYQRASGCTIIMISHDWEGARAHASHALLINRTIRAFGPAAETAANHALLELFGHTGHVKATH
ncbi:MAG: ATP-binding cassette domain-containing protein [Candidatus Hydrogenedens sp.]|nr:ATP-binding cassette domain-containing protein [Candidatus Hydrogenedens sp.]